MAKPKCAVCETPVKKQFWFRLMEKTVKIIIDCEEETCGNCESAYYHIDECIYKCRLFDVPLRELLNQGKLIRATICRKASE